MSNLSSSTKPSTMREKLKEVNWLSPSFLIFYSIFMGFFIAGLAITFMGYNPFDIYNTMLYNMFGKPAYMVQIVIKSTPIILTGIAFIFASKTGLFNIGVEGQFMMGAIWANLAGTFITLPWFLHIPFVVIVGFLGGALFASIMGILKAFYNVHEVISAIMLNWVAYYLNNYFVSMPFLKKPNSEFALPIQPSASISILKEWKISPEGLAWRQENPFLGDILKSNNLNLGIFFAIITAFIVYFVLRRTTLGYRLKAVGNNPRASRYLGINVPYNLALSLAISGGIAGLAGALQVIGVDGAIYKLLVPRGYGFDGIAVAFLALGNPIGAIFSGLFYSALEVGGSRLQGTHGLSSHVIALITSIIIFFVAMPYFFIKFFGDASKFKMKFFHKKS